MDYSIANTETRVREQRSYWIGHPVRDYVSGAVVSAAFLVFLEEFLTATAEEEFQADAYWYPRPQLQRDQWISLNGNWDFAFDSDAAWTDPHTVEWNASIVVPFSPETRASGLNESGFYRAVWYRRHFEPP